MQLQNYYLSFPQNVVLKGYVDKKNFLVEKLKLKNFVEFVYANEFLAKDSFDNLIKRIENTDSLKILKQISKEEESHADYSIDTLNKIMTEEDRHWTFAKLFYNKKFPNSNLSVAFKKEKIKNKMRMFYYKNVLFLNKIFAQNSLILSLHTSKKTHLMDFLNL